MASRDGEVVLVFNGEIYNHPKLKPQFELAGDHYATRSDTETILHAYTRYGTNCVDHLDGMFAFVLYDRRQRLLFGARDRLGKKPLYYTACPFGEVLFAFASELKSLRAHSSISQRRTTSEAAMVSYLLNDYVQGTQSIDHGILRLEPGHAFTYGLPDSASQGFRTWCYWQPHFGTGSATTTGMLSPQTVGARLIELLERAVERRLMADVPLGVFLSGGVDSSAILALVRRQVSMPIKAFSVGIEYPGYDESEHAAAVAQRLGVEHIVRKFTVSDLVERIPRVAQTLDEPFADPSMLPSSMLSDLAAEHVKVVLGGDGADELFAGYDPFRALTAAQWYRRLMPPWLDWGTRALAAACLRETDHNMSPWFKGNRFLRGARANPDRRIRLWMGAFTPGELRRLLPDISPGTIEEQMAGSLIGTSQAQHNDLDQTLAFYQRAYLPDDILFKMDRATMASSLEFRAPFLDTELVEFVNQLSGDFKLRAGTTKWILKRALIESGLVPESVVQRRKQGFGIPVSRWMRVELHDYFRTALLDDWPSGLEMIDRTEVHRLWRQHQRRAANNYKELWALFMLAQWQRYHGCGQTSTVAADPERISPYFPVNRAVKPLQWR